MATIFKQVKVSGRTLEMTCDVYSLEMAIVYRKDVKDLDDQWKCPGIYVLVWRVGGQKLGGYVGMARELSERISHERKFEWDRALIVRRKGFNTAQIGWLEGRIYKLLDEGGVNLQNKLEPGDDTLSVPEQETLEKFVEPIQDALVILGYDPESLQPTLKQTAILEPKEIKPASTNKVHARLLDVVRAGTQIESASPSYPATAMVEATGIRYEGQLFGSPSAAAKAVTGQDTADGWSFWSVRSDSGALVRLTDLRTRQSSTARDTSTVHDQRRTETKQRRGPKPSRQPQRKGIRTPAKMSATMKKRLLARRDEGATYVQLQKEFGLTQGSVYSLLKKAGRIGGS